MKEDRCLVLLKFQLIILSRCRRFIEDLRRASLLRTLDCENFESVSIAVDVTLLEERMYKLLQELNALKIEDIKTDRLQSLAEEIFERLSARIDEYATFTKVWSCLVEHLVRQWNVRLKRMILDHFNVAGSTDHLSESDRSAIRLLGRVVIKTNPYSVLTLGLTEVADDFSSNLRTTGRRDVAYLSLAGGLWRARGRGCTVTEVLLDRLRYRLCHGAPSPLPPDCVQPLASTPLTTAPASLSTILSGRRTTISKPPLVLVLLLDDLEEEDGEGRPASFPDSLSGDDICPGGSVYDLVALETCRGGLHLYEGGRWRGGSRAGTGRDRVDREGLRSVVYLSRDNTSS